MTAINVVTAQLYTNILDNASDRVKFKERELIQVSIPKDGYDTLYPIVCDHIKTKLNKLLALDGYKATLTFEPNLANYHTFKSLQNLYIIVCYSVRKISRLEAAV